MDIVKLLNLNGISNVFNEMTNVNGNWLRKSFHRRTSDIYKEKVSEETHNNLLCISYRMMTTSAQLQNYPSIVPKQYSTIKCMFMSANFKLPIVTGIIIFIWKRDYVLYII